MLVVASEALRARNGVVVVAQTGNDQEFSGVRAEQVTDRNLGLGEEAGETRIGIRHTVPITGVGIRPAVAHTGVLTVLLVSPVLAAISDGGGDHIRKAEARAVVQPHAERRDVPLQQLPARSAGDVFQSQLVGLKARLIDDEIEVEQVVGRIVIAVGSPDGLGTDVLVDESDRRLISADALLAVVRFPCVIPESDDAALEAVVNPKCNSGLRKSAEDVVVGILEFVPVTQLYGAGIALRDARDEIGAFVQRSVGGVVARALRVDGLIPAGDGGTRSFAGTEQIFRVQRHETDQSTGTPTAVERRGRSAQDLDLPEQAGIDEKTPVVRGTEVLPRTVQGHDDVGALETTNTGHFAGAPRAAPELDAGYESQYVVGSGGLSGPDLVVPENRDHARVFERFDGIPGGGDRDGIEHGNCRAFARDTGCGVVGDARFSALRPCTPG